MKRKAEGSLASARLLSEQGDDFWASALSRYYYAMFQCAKAVLWKKMKPPLQLTQRIRHMSHEGGEPGRAGMDRLLENIGAPAARIDDLMASYAQRRLADYETGIITESQLALVKEHSLRFFEWARAEITDT